MVNTEEDLELHPVHSSEPISGILWKIGPNKVAEWDEGFGPDVDYYGPFKDRTTLDKKTGKLIIKNMTKEDSGIYSVEVNGRLQSKTYKVEVTSKHALHHEKQKPKRDFPGPKLMKTSRSVNKCIRFVCLFENVQHYYIIHKLYHTHRP